jgi:glycosyltransferase involved in cell wall biosynthesis
LQIVVNTRLLLPHKLDGIGWFTYQTLKRITQNNKDVHFVFLFDRDYSDEFIFSDNITPLVIGPQARHPFLYYTWFHYSVKNILNRMRPDLFLSPDGFLSLGAKCKQLPVIHDINFFHNPKDLKPLTSIYYNHFFPKYAKAAARVATVSEYSKADIAKEYGINPAKINVVYNGINDGFKPITEEEKRIVKDKFAQGKPYFLFVGSQSPRKNLNRLITAFDLFKQQTQSDFKLVLVGAVYTSDGDMKKVIDKSNFKHDILFVGRQPQEELENIMAAAFALTFVPYFEGFGIPIVEAMQCQTPIICSNTTSMPEIAGNAAILVNPFEVNEISKAMVDLYQNENTRQQLILNGIKRKDNFSWDKSANLLWDSITKCL